MDTPNPGKLCLRRFRSGETIGVNNIFVSIETTYRNNVVRKFFLAKVFEVIANLVAQLSQPASQSIVDRVGRDSMTPGRITVSGLKVNTHCKTGENLWIIATAFYTVIGDKAINKL